MISFDQIRNLPLLPPLLKQPTEDQCYETQLGDTLVSVSHRDYPLYGPAFTLSMRGSTVVKQLVLDQFIQEFGPELGLPYQSRAVDFHVFAAPNSDTPSARMNQMLSEERLRRIFRKYELSGEDEEIAREVIANFRTILAKPEERTRYVEGRIAGLSQGRRVNILHAFQEIIFGFASELAE